MTDTAKPDPDHWYWRQSFPWKASEDFTTPSVDGAGHAESPSLFAQDLCPRAPGETELQVLGNSSDYLPAYDCQGRLTGAVL